MNGEIAFEPALIERVSLLKGLPLSVVGEVIEKRITLDSRRSRTDRDHEGKGLLHSAGFRRLHRLYRGRSQPTLGFHENRANILIEKDGHLTGAVAEPILGKQAKVDALVDITTKLGISTADALAVGDGANDLGMLHLAGAGVALHAKPVVSAQVKIRIDHADLTALLYIQGYRKTDFVR